MEGESLSGEYHHLPRQFVVHAVEGTLLEATLIEIVYKSNYDCPAGQLLVHSANMQSYKIEKENTKSDIKVPQNEMDMCPSNYIQEVDALEDISPQRSEQKVNMAICATLNQPNMELSTPIKQLEVNLKESDLYMNEQLSLSTDRQEFTSQGKSRNSIIVETMEVIDEDLIVEHQPKTKEPDGNVGFSNILKQAFQKVVKKGFEFTLMVVGESGLGKSTLINSMFLTDIYNPTVLRPSLERIKKTTTVETTSVILKEDGVTLLLTVVDTPGFGDAVDNSKSWEPIIQYIDKTYEDFSNSEVQPIRKQARDERVHCCLYFIQPSGHGLKSLDIESMKRLCDKVNVVPVIAKADTLTSDECASFKKQILHDIAENEIKIYNFPKLPEENDNLSLKEKIPFAVVGSNTVLDIDGKKVRGRKYPWGIAEVENLEHCDFIALRTMIIRTHLEDLKDVTNNFYYENYRLTKLGNSGPNGRAIRKNKNQAGSEEERREQEFKKKLEEEVLQKEQQLRNSEAEINRRLKFARQQIEEKAKELEEKRKRFEIEKEKWEKESQDTLEELSRKTLEVSREPSSGKEKMKKKKKCFFKK